MTPVIVTVIWMVALGAWTARIMRAKNSGLAYEVYAKWRGRASVFLCILALGCLYYFNTDSILAGEKQLTGWAQALLIFWSLFPPLWFFGEYLAVANKKIVETDQTELEKRIKSFGDFAAKIWVAFSLVYAFSAKAQIDKPVPVIEKPAAPVALRTQLGVAHIGGLYSLTDADYLNEGAAAARDIGARCIKVSLSLDTDHPSPTLYPYHSQWPVVATLDALADTPYYRALFAKDFDTFIMTTFRPGRPAGYWRDQFEPGDEQAEEDCYAALTRYLLRTYGTTHKTFVLQNWEGDWALRGNFDPATKPTPEATAAMIRWLRARQRGVERGRGEFPKASAHVFHACEVNLVRQAIEQGAPSVTADVLPHVSVDLASYSAWDTKDSSARFGDALAFIAKQKRPTEPFGEHGVYVGEFGLPESEATPEKVFERTAALLAVAQSFGCPYAVYWQVYCNEPTAQPPKRNADFKGFWLVRPDGTRSPVCQLFQ